MQIKWLSYALAAGLILSACEGLALPAGLAPAPTQQAVHWTYEGDEGPEHWSALDPSYAACGAGIDQSPIDLAGATPKDLANIDFHYQPSEVRILNNGHTVQVNYDKGSYMEVDGQRYDVVQYHYHAPSEHALNGRLMAAELHVVHKNAKEQYAVVGILLEAGAANAAYQTLADRLPLKKSEVISTGVQLNVADLLPAIQTTFRYSGSLTTPPCTVGVQWFVMTTPVQLDADQLATFQRVFMGNNRPLQPLNTRTLIEDSTR